MDIQPDHEGKRHNQNLEESTCRLPFVLFLLLNQIWVYLPTDKQSQSTDNRWWWKKYSIYLQGTKQGESFLGSSDGKASARNVRDPGSICGSEKSLSWEDPLEKELATHSSILAWKIPWTEEPGGLQSMGSQRVGHDWTTNTFTFKQGEWAAHAQKTRTPWWLSGQSFWKAAFGVTAAGYKTFFWLVGGKVTGWCFGNLNQSSTFWFQSVWGLPACGQNVVTIFQLGG